MSLTPLERSHEATDAAVWEGTVSGLLTLVPSSGAVYWALRTSPAFRARTNWQSRTAMAIMPALFAFAFTSEHKLSHSMREMAQQNQHAQETVRWAEQQQYQQSQAETPIDTDRMLTQLYHKSIEESNVQIVPGSQLSLHHIAANTVADHPMKVLSAFAVPSVLWIFYGNTGKEHLQFSQKILHTRVFGQFATLSLLLTVMMFKEHMDGSGRFITEAEANRRVQVMQRVRQDLNERLEYERQVAQEAKEAIQRAHEQDIRDGKAHHS